MRILLAPGPVVMHSLIWALAGAPIAWAQAQAQAARQATTETRGAEVHRISMGREIVFGAPPPWRVVGEPRSWINELEITNEQGQLLTRAVVSRENQLNRARAIRRLLDLAGPRERGGELVLHEGWPAYKWSREEPLKTRAGRPTEVYATRHTIGVAMDAIFLHVDIHDFTNKGGADRHVRAWLESLAVRPARDPTIGERQLQVVRELRLGNWADQSPMRLPREIDPSDVVALPERRLSQPVIAVPGWGEIEMSASGSGSRVIVGTNSGYARSADHGQTYTAGPGTTPFAAAPRTRGDPSTALGATGRFFLTYLAQADGTGINENAAAGCTVPVAASTDGGASWQFEGNARRCALSVATGGNCFPDQQHMAADSRNTVQTLIRPAPWLPVRRVRSDQVYMVWREFSATATPGSPLACNTIGAPGGAAATTRVSRIACSRNGGRTWTLAPAPVSTSQDFDFSKITVGRDGKVYTASALETSEGWTEIWVDSFESCQSGFSRRFGFPHKVGHFRTPSCLAGLDRCSNVASPTIATSLDFADILWIGAAFHDSAQDSDRIIVGLSPTYGRDFMGWREISDANARGRKFMPWVCATARHLFATWYDRRSATALDNSLTDFYLGRLDFERLGPKVRKNVRVSVAADSHCSSGWPVGTRDTNSATSCALQPQLYGRCLNAAGADVGACNPAAATPPGCSTCSAVNNGLPKYGDYSGMACAGGRAFAAWASNTDQGNLPPAIGPNVWTRAYEASEPPTVFNRWKNSSIVLKWWSPLAP